MVLLSVCHSSSVPNIKLVATRNQARDFRKFGILQTKVVLNKIRVQTRRATAGCYVLKDKGIHAKPNRVSHRLPYSVELG